MVIQQDSTKLLVHNRRNYKVGAIDVGTKKNIDQQPHWATTTGMSRQPSSNTFHHWPWEALKGSQKAEVLNKLMP